MTGADAGTVATLDGRTYTRTELCFALGLADGRWRDAEERAQVLAAIGATGGNYTQAAALLGMSRGTLYLRCAKHRLRKRDLRVRAGTSSSALAGVAIP